MNKKKRKSKTEYFDELYNLAISRGGQLLNTEYLNMHTKYDWRCFNGHTFKMNGNNVKNGKWCKQCYTSIKERICQLYFEAAFGVSFPKSRPEWLINRNGHQLELDGYNEALQIAFEYQGEQHFKKIKVFKMTDDRLNKNQANDLDKELLCEQNNITLFKINYVKNNSMIWDAIVEEANRLSIALPIRKPEVDENKAYLYDERLEQLNTIATSKKGKLISTVYFGAHEKHSFQCELGHFFKSTASNIRNNGSWCPHNPCGVRRDGPAIEDLQNYAASHNGKLLSTNYINNSTPLLWQCEKGHTWEADSRSVWSHKSWCKRCAYDRIRQRRVEAKEIKHQKLAEKNGLSLVEVNRVVTPKNENNQRIRWMITFRCKKNHNFTVREDAITKDQVKCKTCKE